MAKFFDSWQSRSTFDDYDGLRFGPGFALKKAFWRYNEVRLLKDAAKTLSPGFRMLEVGCATGEFHRYLSSAYPKATYKGYDISLPAIDRARSKFPQKDCFSVVDEHLEDIRNARSDIVICRDVIHHQPDPFDFIRKLYNLSDRYVIARIRTRDAGESVIDPELSCQYVSGSWVPVSVLNCDHLVSELLSMEPKPVRIKIVKDYLVLGGFNARFLPKSCYEESSRTAMTALLIEKGEAAGASPEVTEEEQKETWSRNLIGTIMGKSIKLLTGRGYAGRIWW